MGKTTQESHNWIGPPFLSVEGLLSTRATLSSFYLLVEFRHALYKKKPPYMFEMNQIYVLDQLRHV